MVVVGLFFYGLGLINNAMNTDTWHNQLSSSDGRDGSEAPLGGSLRVEGREGVTFRDGMNAMVLD